MWTWFASIATAQVIEGAVPDLNAQTFRPSVDGDRLLWADDAGKRLDQEFVGRFLIHFVDDPLVYTTADDVQTKLVSSVFQVNLLGGYQIGPLRAGLDLPVYLFAGSQVVAGQGGLGDIALDGKVTALDGEAAPIDVALNLRVSFPTATVTTSLGSPSVGWELAGIVSREFGPLLLAANLGTRGGPPADLENITLNDYFIGRLGVGYALAEDYGASMELAAQLPYTAELANSAGWPLEFLTGGYGYANRDVVVRGGVGGGLSPGIGSPDFRLVVGVGYEPRPDLPPADTDGDGLVDDVDQCPAEPEDFDQFVDEDGCPDPDNDQDGILDLVDQCPLNPEDKDGWQDENGCPEPTTQVTVVVVDKVTQAPLDIARVGMACGEWKKGGTAPLVAEVTPGPCTIGAAAGGYVRTDQALEVVNGPPIVATLELAPAEAARVVISRERIELKDTIRFETAKATIKPQSFALLDEAVQILVDYPEVKKLRIEGHTDERGSESYNLELSKKRAASVLTYFVNAGINPARLASEGFGESRPLEPGHNEAAWSKNRRTDFFVEVWEAVEVAP